MSGLLTPEQLAEAFASNDKAAIMGHIEAQGALLPTAAPGSYEEAQRKFGAEADAAKAEVLKAYPLASIACASVSGDRLMRRTWYIDADTTGKRISAECGTPEEAWISAGELLGVKGAALFLAGQKKGQQEKIKHANAT